MHDDITPTPVGLLRCLQVLTEEAAWLGLTRTFAVLHQAIEACRVETANRVGQASSLSDSALLH